MPVKTYRLPWWLSGKESACNVGDASLIPGLGRSPGEGKGTPVQYSCLGNPMDRGDCCATVYRVARVRYNLVTEQQREDICQGQVQKCTRHSEKEKKESTVILKTEFNLLIR